MRRIVSEKRNTGEKFVISVTSDFSVQSNPRVVRLEPSSLCNLKCIHCPTGTRKDVKRGNMTDEIFAKIIEELKAMGNVDVAVLYHGGEPFLNRKIFSMIKTLRSIGISFVKIVTNGMLLNKDLILDIISAKINWLYVSLDGCSPKENNRIRCGSNYYQIVKNVKHLLERKARLKCSLPKVCICNSQIPTEADIQNEVQPATPTNILHDFAEFREELKFENIYLYQWPGLDLSDNFRIIENPRAQGIEPSRFCDHTLQTITIRWNGDIVPCCLDLVSKCVMDNIMKNSLPEIWNNSKYRQLRKRIYFRDFPSLCKRCLFLEPRRFFVVKT